MTENTPHILSRDEILRAEVDDNGQPILPWQQVDVPEWGGSVIVQGLTGTGRDRFEGTLVTQRGRKMESNLENFRAKLIAQSIVDKPGGKLVFREGDIPALGRKSASALERVYTVATKLSKLSPDDVEELTKDLGEDPSGDSGSDSPWLSDTEASLNVNNMSLPPSSQNG